MIKRFAKLLTILVILALGYQFPVQAAPLPNPHSISGTVTVTNNYSFGNAGITVALGSYTATTATDGSYTISGIPDGQSGTLTPSSDCELNFTPGSISITDLSSDLSDQDFTVDTGGCTISGRVTTSSGAGLAGVSIEGFATTDSTGNYSVTGVPYYVTGYYSPSLAGYTFTPSISDLLGPVTADITGVNFVANTGNISGTVTSGGVGLSGVVVALGTFMSNPTGSNGKYTILDVPLGITEDLTPTLAGYTFSPTKITITDLPGSITGQDFTATLNTYSISGTVTVGSSGLAGVTVALGSYHDMTDGSGNYTITGVPYGTSGDLTPSLAGYTFSPTKITVTSLSGTLTGKNFTATLNTYNISGTVTVGSSGLAGVTVALGSYNDTTDGSGNYTITGVPYGTSGDLTPSLAGYTFSPTKITVTSLSGTLTGKNFTATLNTYNISGTVTVGSSGLAGVTVALGSYNDTTDGSGNYTITAVPYGTSGDLTPSLAGYTFSPTKITITSLSGTLTGKNFTATLNTYSISGKVTVGSSGLAGVTVALGSYHDTTDGSGNYTITDVPYGTSGDLTPTLAGYTFSPTKITVTSLSGTLTGKNFTATLNTYNISGTVTVGSSGLAGVTVALGSYHDTTDGSGNYTITDVPYGTSGDLTPTLAGYTFSPTKITVTSLSGTLIGKNFTATLNTYNISGTVTVGSSGLAGVTVSLGSYHATTDGSGNYTITDVDYGTSGDLTPTLAGYIFNPVNINIDPLTGDLTGKNFAATKVYLISGKVTIGNPPAGRVGVTVALGSYNATTNNNGIYTITIPATTPGAKGSLIATLSGYTFNPTYFTVPAMTGNLVGKNFVATQSKFRISGNVTIGGKALKGVSIQTTSNGLTIPPVVTDGNGHFSISNLLSNHIYTVTPVLAGYSFNPPNFVSPSLLSNQTANFAATLLFENISGTVSGLNGTTIQIRYGAGKTQLVSTNAADGSFAINNLPQNVSYTLTPISPLPPLTTIFRFSPTSLVIPAGNGNTTNANIAATQQVIMSGNVSVQGKAVKGVTVSLKEFSFIHTMTDSHGNYSVWVPMGVTITPTATHPYFAFADGPSTGHPSNFTQPWSTAVVNLTGHVLLNGSGLKNVTLTVSPAKGAVPLTTTTDTNGAYALTVTTGDTPNLYSFVVTPALTGYTFSPKSKTFTPSSSVTKNFTAIPNKWSVSGTVTSNSKGLSGVEIDFTINGGKVHKDFTNSKGAYTLTGVPFGATIVITPKKTGFSFTPTSITLPMGNANLTGQNFTTN